MGCGDSKSAPPNQTATSLPPQQANVQQVEIVNTQETQSVEELPSLSPANLKANSESLQNGNSKEKRISILLHSVSNTSAAEGPITHLNSMYKIENPTKKVFSPLKEHEEDDERGMPTKRNTLNSMISKEIEFDFGAEEVEVTEDAIADLDRPLSTNVSSSKHEAPLIDGHQLSNITSVESSQIQLELLDNSISASHTENISAKEQAPSDINQGRQTNALPEESFAPINTSITPDDNSSNVTTPVTFTTDNPSHSKQGMSTDVQSPASNISEHSSSATSTPTKRPTSSKSFKTGGSWITRQLSGMFSRTNSAQEEVKEIKQDPLSLNDDRNDTNINHDATVETPVDSVSPQTSQVVEVNVIENDISVQVADVPSFSEDNEVPTPSAEPNDTLLTDINNTLEDNLNVDKVGNDVSALKDIEIVEESVELPNQPEELTCEPKEVSSHSNIDVNEIQDDALDVEEAPEFIQPALSTDNAEDEEARRISAASESDLPIAAPSLKGKSVSSKSAAKSTDAKKSRQSYQGETATMKASREAAIAKRNALQSKEPPNKAFSLKTNKEKSSKALATQASFKKK